MSVCRTPIRRRTSRPRGRVSRGRLAAGGPAGAFPGGRPARKPRGAPAGARGKPYRIDVHHHLMSPGYLEEVGGGRAGSTFKWSPAMSIEDMDKSGIAVSVLSLIQPAAVTNEVEKGRKIPRLSNDYGAQLPRDPNCRFARFPTLPLLEPHGVVQ